jgi:hypothetical protein
MRGRQESWEETWKEFKQWLKEGEPFVLACTAHAPYDGCFHEWNYSQVTPGEQGCDRLQQFGEEEIQVPQFCIKPIYASGRIVKQAWSHTFGEPYTVKTPEVTVTTTPIHPPEKGDPEQAHMQSVLLRNMLGFDDYYDGFEFYAIDSDLHKCICDGMHHRFVEVLGEDFQWECSNCGELGTGEPFYTGYHGIGGTAVQMDDPVCGECYGSGLCASCSEYVGADELDSHSRCKDHHIETVLDMIQSGDAGKMPDSLWEQLSDLQDVISRGNAQCATLRRLVPEKASEYLTQHHDGSNRIMKEIADAYWGWVEDQEDGDVWKRLDCGGD